MTSLRKRSATLQREGTSYCSVTQALGDGGPETEAAALVMGLGNMMHKQVA